MTGPRRCRCLPSSGLPAPRPELDQSLPLMGHGEDVIHDYRTLSYSLKAHPLSFLRQKLERRGTLPASAARRRVGNGARVEVAGLVLVRQRPGTASGIVFATLEDETGIANIVIWAKMFETFRKTILSSKLLAVRGRLQIEGLVVHVVAEDFTDFTPDLVALAQGHSLGDAVIAHADEAKTGPHGSRSLARERAEQMDAARKARAALPDGRNFR